MKRKSKPKQKLPKGYRKPMKPVSLEENPTYGYFTLAKPKLGVEQDFEQANEVERMLAGALLPGKKLVRFEVTATYSDGEKQCLYTSTNPRLRVDSFGESNGVVQIALDDQPLSGSLLVTREPPGPHERSTLRKNYGMDISRPR